MKTAKHNSDFELTKDIAYPTLMSKLWVFFFEFGRKLTGYIIPESAT